VDAEKQESEDFGLTYQSIGKGLALMEAGFDRMHVW
jgi:hypothetical protein